MSLTAQEVAEKLGVHRMTIYRMVKKGVFPNAYRLGFGQQIFIPESDLEGAKKLIKELGVKHDD